MLSVLGITLHAGMCDTPQQRANVVATSVTSKGQVTTPKLLRQRLGLRQGCKVEFILVGDPAEMRVASTPAKIPSSGFGMLKSRQAAVPADFDPSDLMSRRNRGRAK